MKRSSTACSTRPATASTWRGSGSTPPATATPMACTSTTIARRGPTATGSSSAFNANKPFDRFIVEQFAGDLLPSATLDQIDRHRLQPLPRFDQRRGLDRGGGLRPQHRGPGRYQRHRLPGIDHRLRPLPRPQVRPDPHEGLLPALRVLQQHRRPGARRQLRQMGTDRPGARRQSRRRPWTGRCQDRRDETDDRGRGGQGRGGLRRQGRRRSRARPPAGRFRLDRRRLARGRQPQGDGPWDFVGKPDHPVSSGSLPCGITAKGSISGSSTTPDASSRSARATRCLLMFISTRSIRPGS